MHLGVLKLACHRAHDGSFTAFHERNRYRMMLDQKTQQGIAQGTPFLRESRSNRTMMAAE